VKKLISIGVALSLLVTFMVPVAVAAEYPTNPGTYSKTPFGILGTGIELLGTLLGDLAEPLGLPDWIAPLMPSIGGYVGENLAWMTDMTAWSMVLVGDVVKKADSVVSGVAELPFPLGDVAEIFYVVSARLWDPWGEATEAPQLPDAVIVPYPPTLP
jgi:hypothetical protein